MPTLAAFNLKEKATGNLYKKCICGCGADTDKPIVLNSAEEAKDIIKYLKLTGWVPTIYVDDSWKIREHNKFGTGEYQVPLWFDEPWFKDAMDSHFKKYYPHVAKNSPDKISITDTPEKGMQDIQTAILPGKYLKRFFGKVLSDEQIKMWANKHTEEWGKPLELRIAETGEEISEVYQMDSGFTSCMQKPVTYWASLLNPTYAYGDGDIKLGYIVDRRGKLLARALMMPNLKLVGRVYGDEHRFRAAVKEKFGFDTESSNRDYNILESGHIQKIRYGHGSYVVPYVDGNMGLDGIDPRQYIISPYGNTRASSTTGLIGNDMACECCGEKQHNRRYRVFYNLDRTEWSHWCYDCWTKYSARDDFAGRISYYNSDHVRNIKAAVDFDPTIGETIARKVVLRDPDNRDNLFVKDNYTGVYFDKSKSVSINGGHRWILEKALPYYAKSGKVFKSEFDNKLYGFDYQPVRVDDMIWSNAQVSDYADFDEASFTFHRRNGIAMPSEEEQELV